MYQSLIELDAQDLESHFFLLMKVFLSSVAMLIGAYFCQASAPVRQKVPTNVSNDAAGSVLRDASSEFHTPNHPHVQLAYPAERSGVGYMNGPKGKPFETDCAVGEMFFLHRRSDNTELDRSCNYPYGEVFRGKSINWECRMHMRFKRMPEGPLTFGIELDEYVPLGPGTRYAMSLVVKALKYIVGDQVHHSTGDDPATRVGECEKPIFVMPMFAWDQVVVTPNGQPLPDMTAANFSQLGLRRDRDTTEFMDLMRNFTPELDKTYTLSFCSISKFLDLVRWRIVGALPGVSLDMDAFCGRAPVHMKVYGVRPAACVEDEHRHLASRQDICHHVAIWSDSRPLPPQQFEEVTGIAANISSSQVVSAQRTLQQNKSGCCSCFAGLCGRSA